MATSSELQQLYVAYFGRPADPAGLTYWVSSGITTKAFAALMYDQPEFKSVNSGLSVEAQVNQIYLNLFGRNADSAGLLYWTQQINTGKLQLASIANDLIYAVNNGSNPTDLAALTNKTNTAVAFTQSVTDTSGALLAYQPQSDGKDGRPWVSGTNFATAVSFMNTATATNAPTTAQITASVATIAANGAPGQTITLTTDRFSYLGGPGNDTFVAGLNAAGQQTLLAPDSIDGAGGTNTLIATIINDVTPASIRNIQSINATFQAARTLDLSNAVGVQSILNNGSTGNATLSGLSTSTAITSQSTASDLTLNFAGATGTSDSAALTLSGVSAGTVAIPSNNIETLLLTSSGSTTNILTALNGGTSLTTLNIGGAAGLTINGALANVRTVAQAVGGPLSGALTLTFAQGAVTATGGAGNDTFRIQGAGNANLSGGAGNETFIFDAGFFTNTDTVSGGDGSNTLRISAADATVYVAPATETVTGVQTLAISDALAANLNASNIASSINTVNLRQGTNAAVTLTGNAGTFGVTLGANGSNGGVVGGDLTINDVGIATTDVLNLSNGNTAAQNAFGGAGLDLLLNGYETVNLATGVTASGAQQTRNITLQADGTAASVLNVSGANNLTVNQITAGSINASGLSGTAWLRMGAAAVGATSITGGAGADRLRTAATGTLVDGGGGADTLDGGAGADTLRGGAGNDSIVSGGGNDNIDGGEGDDTVDLNVAGVGTLTANDTVDGGTGTNTVVLAQTATAAEGARLSNFQVLETGNNQLMSRFSATTFTTVAQNVAGVLVITDASASLNTFNTTAAVGNINSSFRRATDTTTNALTFNAGAALANGSALSVDDEETVTINTTDLAVNLDLDNAVDLTTLNITGTGNTAAAIDITALGATNLSSVTFSGINTTRAVTIDASASTVNLSLAGGDFTGTYTTGSGADSVSGGALADVITTNNGADTVNSGGGNDYVLTGAGNDVINLGTGADTLDAGTGADAVTLTVDGTTDRVRQISTYSLAASSTSFEGANVAAGDSMTFGNGVDVVNNFLAGAGAGADQLEVLVGGAIPNSLIGQTVADLSAGNAVFYASGTFNAATGRFTISANGVGPDTMIIQSTGAGASDNLTTNASGLVLVGVDSDNFAAGNFIAAATVYQITAPTVVSSTTGLITGGAVSAANLLTLGFTTLNGGVIGDANTLTINGGAGTQTFNSATGVFTGATNASVNQLIYQNVDTVSLGEGSDTYTTASIAAGTTTVNAGAGLDTLAFTAGSTTAVVNLGTSTVVTGFENIDASLNAAVLNATLVADSTSYVTSANGDTVNFANAAGNAVAVNAAANTEANTLTFAAGDASDVVTVASVRFDVAAAGLASNLVVNAIDAADNAFTVTTGTGNTTVNNGVAGDVITVAAAAAADGRLVTVGGISAYTVTGLNADLSSSANGAVGVTSASTTAQTLTNTGIGLVTANIATIADGAVITVAGAGPGGFTLNNVSADVLSSATGAVTVNSAAVGTQTVTNNSGNGAMTVNAAALADNAALTISGSSLGANNIQNLSADLSITTTGGVTTATVTNVPNLTVTSTSTSGAASTVNAAAMVAGQQLVTAGTAALNVTNLLADLTNTNAGLTTATLGNTGAADAVTVNSTTAMTVVNGDFTAADTLTLAGAGIKNVGGAAGFLGAVALDGTNGNGSTITIGIAATAVTQANGAGSFTVNATALAQNALLTINGAGTAASTAAITNLVGDATLNGNASRATIALGDAADNGITLTTGTGNTTVSGGNATDAIAVTSNVADNGTLRLSNNALTKTVTTLSADLTNSGAGALTATLENVANLTINSDGAAVTVNNGAYVRTNDLTLQGASAYTIGVNGGQEFLGDVFADAGAGAIAVVAGNVNGIQIISSVRNGTTIDATDYVGANDVLTLRGAGTKVVTTGGTGADGSFTIDFDTALAGQTSVNAAAFDVATDVLTLTDTGVNGPAINITALGGGSVAAGTYASDITVAAGAAATNQALNLGSATNTVNFNSANLTALDVITKAIPGATLTLNLTGNNAIAAGALDGVLNANTISFANTTTNVGFTVADATNYLNAGTYSINAAQLTTGALTFTAAAETTAGVIFSVTGGAGNDNITGAGGNDTLIGGAGADTITGGAGADDIRAGDGNNQVQGGTGADTITYGAGGQVYILANGDATAADTITGMSVSNAAGNLIQIGDGALGALVTSTSGELSTTQSNDITAADASLIANVGANVGAGVDLSGAANTGIKFTNVTATDFASAIGTTDITVGATGGATSDSYLAFFYDSDRVINGVTGAMIMGSLTSAANTTTVNRATSVFTELGVFSMTAADYTANLTSASVDFI